MKAIKTAILSSVLLALAGFILLAPGAHTSTAQTPPETKTNYLAQNTRVNPNHLAQNTDVRNRREEKQGTDKRAEKAPADPKFRRKLKSIE